MDLSGLLPHQPGHLKQLLQALARYSAALDASDTGTGKTWVALVLCRILGVIPLVVGPKNARGGWEDAARAIGVEIEYVNYEKVRYFRRNEKTGRMESAWVEQFPYGSGSFLKWKDQYFLIIFDEVHRCGGMTSLNSKLLIAAKRQAQYVLALSATAADDPRQMKALGYALGLHQLNAKRGTKDLSFMSWLLRHGCTPGTFGGFDFTANKDKQKKAFSKLHQEIFPHRGARMRKGEIPGFPKTQIDVRLFVDESGKAEKIAEELHGLDGEKTPDLGGIQRCRQDLEKLKVPFYVDLAEDLAQTSKIAVFLNFTEPLFECYESLRKRFGNDRVGYISGEQTGVKGAEERIRFMRLFQGNNLEAIVCNSQAGGESISLHDPVTQVERSTIISPCESGRQFQQIIGRVNRAGGGFSLQLMAYFKGTREEDVAHRLKQKNFNLAILNDGDWLV